MGKIEIKRIRYLCFAAMILLLPIMTYKRAGGIIVNLSYADYLLPAALLLVYWGSVPRQDPGVRRYIKLLYVLLALMILSIVNIIKWQNMSEAFRAYASSIMKFLICLVYVWVFGRFFSEHRSNIRRIIDLFILSSILQAMLAYFGVALYYTGIANDWIYHNTYRACASFNDPNLFACFLFLGMYLSLYQLQKERKARYLIALILLFGAVLLSASKAAFIGLAVFLVVLFLSSLAAMRGRIKIAYMAILVIAVAALLYVFLFTDLFMLSFSRFSTLLNSYSNTEELTTGRFNIWERALVMMEDSPVFGVGYGMHSTASRQLYLSIGDYVLHNTFLNYIVELGIFGLGWMLVSLWRLMKVQLRISRAGGGYGLFGLLGAILFMAFTLNLENFRNLWIFFCLLALLSSRSLGTGAANEQKKSNR